jgi:hypothetical protein
VSDPSSGDIRRDVDVRDAVFSGSLSSTEPSRMIRVEALRRVAVDAGIEPATVDAAFQRAMRVKHTKPPIWLRVGMFGVPDRAAAMGYYWIFVIGLIAVVPAVKLHWLPQSAGIFAACWMVFSLWSTNACIRWLDQYGWDARNSVRESDART